MTHIPENQPNDVALTRTFAQLSEQDFANIGVNQVAYIRPTLVSLHDDIKQRVKAFSIHAADGETLAITATFEQALMAIRNEGMNTAALH